ncbi:hypothetical protein IWZ01DRAFT_538797 [Phyllosticta capitalensis]
MTSGSNADAAQPGATSAPSQAADLPVEYGDKKEHSLENRRRYSRITGCGALWSLLAVIILFRA